MLIWVGTGLMMVTVEMSGDEGHYFRNSRYIWSLLDLGPDADTSAQRLANSLVGRGWFLPGMSLVLAPLGLIGAGVGAARLYTGLVALLLVLLTSRLVEQSWGRRSGILFFAVLTLNPYFIAMSFTFWGGALGGLVVSLLMVLVWRLSTRMWQRRVMLRARDVVVPGLLLAAAIYVRPPMVFAAPIAFGCLAIAAMAGVASPARSARSLASLGLLAALVLLAVLPWSTLVSSRLGRPYLLTTTADFGWVMAFGDPESRAAFGNNYGGLHRHVVALAAAEDISYGDAAALFRDEVASDVSRSEYLTRVLENYRGYLGGQNGYLVRFENSGVEGEPDGVRSHLFASARTATPVYLRSLFVLAAAAVGFMAWIGGRHRWLALPVAALMLMGLIFPLLSSVNGRHIVDFIPTATLVLAVGTVEVMSRLAPPNSEDTAQ